MTYWTFTVLLVFELAAGSLWNLLQIDLTLPAVNDAFHKRAVDLGWIAC